MTEPSKRRPKSAPDFGTRVLQGGLGDVVLRPWFDWFALRGVARFYLPLSRAWADAIEADGDMERFSAAPAGPTLSRSGMARAVKTVGRRHEDYVAAEAHWRSTLFGDGTTSSGAAAAAERRRAAAAHNLMATRSAFLPWLRRLPPVKWDLAGPGAVERRQGHRLEDPTNAFSVADLPTVEQSRSFEQGGFDVSWLRFQSPVLEDTAWAKVETPSGVKDPPTLIFLHGIAMETEMWRGSGDTLLTGLGRHFRIVRPEGPWHGRRRPAGWYGGEPIIARGPLGLIELFHGWITDLAVLIDWARQTSAGPVVVGGVSLGALTSQLTATVARAWPPERRPDAVFLVATTSDVVTLEEDSSLTRAVELSPQMRACGWRHEDLTRYHSLLEPTGEPAVPADRIVMLLGSRDDVTQFQGGLSLAKDWGVPDENLFTQPRGHFSVALGMIRNPAPLYRLREIVEAMG